MKALTLPALLAFLYLSTSFAAPLDEAIQSFSGRFETAQPSAEQLAIWKLDWEDQLSTALDRAKNERRPVLFIHVTNISGPSNFGSGHC